MRSEQEIQRDSFSGGSVANGSHATDPGAGQDPGATQEWPASPPQNRY